MRLDDWHVDDDARRTKTDAHVDRIGGNVQSQIVATHRLCEVIFGYFAVASAIHVKRDEDFLVKN